MDFASTKRVRGQSNRAGLQDSSRAALSAGAAAFERQLSEIANSGGGGGAIPAGSAPQPAQFVKRLSKRPLHFRDEDFIFSLQEALIKGGAAENTARVYVDLLLSFGRWLFANNKDPIKDRLDKQSLTDDAREFVGKSNAAKLFTAIGHLRTAQSTGGIVPIAGRAEVTPHREDVALIDEYKNEAAISTNNKRNAIALRSFSDYLRQNNKKGIAGRLFGNALDGDVKDYKKEGGGDPKIGYALACLQKSQAGAKMQRERHIPLVPIPEDAALMQPRRVGEAIAQHSAWQEAVSWPKDHAAAAHVQDVRLELMDGPGPFPQPAQFVKRLSNRPLHPGDSESISALEAALIKGNAAENTARVYLGSLLSFGRWLFANNKDPIKDRLDHGSLIEDALKFIGNRKPKTLLTAIGHLRTSQSTGGVVTIAGRAELTPYPHDAALINQYRDEAQTINGRSTEIGVGARIVYWCGFRQAVTAIGFVA